MSQPPIPDPGSASALAARNSVWAELVARMAAGDQRALGALYDDTSPILFGLALRVLGSREDAEEAVLDAYARAWRLSSTFDGSRGSALTWLVMMARSIAIDRLRSRTAKSGREEAIDGIAEPAGSGLSPESEAFFTQQRFRIEAALDQLPAEQRQAIELAFFDGLSHSEVAEATGVPLGTAKTRVRLGLARLRQVLEGNA
ncbi:MAG: sigma-70 family RNA polymerase sigma factor [Bryobacteraceae bacterium]